MAHQPLLGRFAGPRSSSLGLSSAMSSLCILQTFAFTVLVWKLFVMFLVWLVPSLPWAPTSMVLLKEGLLTDWPRLHLHLAHIQHPLRIIITMHYLHLPLHTIICTFLFDKLFIITWAISFFFVIVFAAVHTYYLHLNSV